MRGIALAAVAAVVIGCGGSPWTEPPSTTVCSDWTGTLSAEDRDRMARIVLAGLWAGETSREPEDAEVAAFRDDLTAECALAENEGMSVEALGTAVYEFLGGHRP